MSNFADMAYDNYLMHYRTKGSKNGYTKDPDYTPVGKKADYAGMPSSVKDAQERAKEEKRDRMKSNAEAKRKAEYMKSDAEARRKREYDPNAIAENEERRKLLAELRSKQKINKKGRSEREKAARRNEINMRSGQARRGDYAGMPSSARAAIENAERAKEISERAKLERFKAKARNKNLMWEAWRRKWKNQRGY